MKDFNLCFFFSSEKDLIKTKFGFSGNCAVRLANPFFFFIINKEV